MNITGQLFFRKTGKTTLNKARKEVNLIMVIGILGVENPDDFQDETQYVVVGTSRKELMTDLTILNDYKINRKKETEGAELGHIVTLPIWKV